MQPWPHAVHCLTSDVLSQLISNTKFTLQLVDIALIFAITLTHVFLQLWGWSRRSALCASVCFCQSHYVAEHLLSGVSWSVLPLCWSVRHVRVASASHLVLLVGCRRSLRGPSRLVGPSVTSAFASASHPCCWPVAVGRCVVRRAFRRPVRHVRVCLRQSPCVAGRMLSGVAWSVASSLRPPLSRLCCQSPFGCWSVLSWLRGASRPRPFPRLRLPVTFGLQVSRRRAGPPVHSQLRALVRR